MSWETLGRGIGMHLRFVAGALALGYWQHNTYAGIFGYILLLSIEQEK
jgi:hypothetical protein